MMVLSQSTKLGIQYQPTSSITVFQSPDGTTKRVMIQTVSFAILIQCHKKGVYLIHHPDKHGNWCFKAPHMKVKLPPNSVLEEQKLKRKDDPGIPSQITIPNRFNKEESKGKDEENSKASSLESLHSVHNPVAMLKRLSKAVADEEDFVYTGASSPERLKAHEATKKKKSKVKTTKATQQSVTQLPDTKESKYDDGSSSGAGTASIK